MEGTIKVDLEWAHDRELDDGELIEAFKSDVKIVASSGSCILTALL